MLIIALYCIALYRKQSYIISAYSKQQSSMPPAGRIKMKSIRSMYTTCKNLSITDMIGVASCGELR